MHASRPRVFITGELPGASEDGRGVLDPLRDISDCRTWPEARIPSPGELRAEVAGCHGLLCLLTDRVDRGLITASPDLQVISSCSVGVDHIDVAAATEKGIPVGNTPGVLTDATADLAFGLLLAAARRLPEADRFVRGRHWQPERRWDPQMLLGADLAGATLGLVGLGAIGRAVARRASGFGMRVLGWTRSGRSVEGVESRTLHEVLAASDFVSIHVALADATRNLIDAAAIAKMKPGAILVNTARGGIVDETALAAALERGALAAAALDVFAEEPLEAASPLRDLPNVVLVPHIGSATYQTRERMARLAVANLIAGLEGRSLPSSVNSGVSMKR